jgi:hypothetical protein
VDVSINRISHDAGLARYQTPTPPVPCADAHDAWPSAPELTIARPVIAANVGEPLHLSLPAMPTAAVPLPQADRRVDA